MYINSLNIPKSFVIVVSLLIALVMLFAVFEGNILSAYFLLPVGIVLLIVMFLRPLWGFAVTFGFTAAYFLILSGVIQKSIVIASLRDILFIIFLISLFLHKKAMRHMKAQEIFLVVFMFYSTFILVYYGIRINTLSDYRYFVLYPLLVLVAKNYQSKDLYDKISFVVIVCTTFFAVYGLLGIFGIIRFWGVEDLYVRFGITESIPGYVFYASLIAEGIIFLTISLYNAVTKRKVLFYLLLLGIHFAALLLSFVRSSWVGLLVSLTYIILVNAKSRRVFNKFAVLGLVMLCVILLLANFPMIKKALIVGVSNYDSALDRIYMWIEYYRDVTSNLIGNGFGQFSGGFETQMGTDIGYKIDASDGTFFRVFYSLGPFGLCCYVLFLIFQLRTIFRVKKLQNAVYLNMSTAAIMLSIFFIITGLFSDSINANHLIVPLYLFYGQLNSVRVK